MSGHNTLHEMFNEACPYSMVDPGDTGTLTVDRQMAIFGIITAGAETRTLARPTKPGIICTVMIDTYVGALTLTVTGGYDLSANPSITFSAVGERVTFLSVKTGTTFQWQVVDADGTSLATGDEALDEVVAGTAAASKALVLNAAKGIGTITTLTSTECVATNVNATNVNATLVAATNVNATNATLTSTVKAATVNATTNINTAECVATNANVTNVTASSTVKGATVNATTTLNTALVTATNVNATNATLTSTVKAATVNATTNLNTAECVATNVNATNANVTLCAATNVNATNVTATSTVKGTALNVNNAVIGLTSAANIGFFGHAAATQPTGIANANNNTDNLATQLNSVIAALEALGIIATV